MAHTTGDVGAGGGTGGRQGLGGGGSPDLVEALASFGQHSIGDPCPEGPGHCHPAALQLFGHDQEDRLSGGDGRAALPVHDHVAVDHGQEAGP